MNRLQRRVQAKLLNEYHLELNKPRVCCWSGCVGPAIQSHTIQRNGSLSQIADYSKQVYTANIAEGSVRKLSIKKASTFSGFCKDHEMVFTRVETQPFTGQPDQFAVLGYRATSFEIAIKEALRVVNLKQLSQFSNVGQSIMKTHLYDQDAAKAELKDLCTLYEKTLENRTYDNFKYVGFEFESNDHGFYVTGSVDPEVVEVSIGNGVIQSTLSQRNLCNISMLGKGNKVWFTMSWPSDCNMRPIVDRLKSLPSLILPNVLLGLSLLMSESVYFSIDWYDSLSSDVKDNMMKLLKDKGEIEFLGSKMMEPLQISSSPLLDWKFQQVIDDL